MLPRFRLNLSIVMLLLALNLATVAFARPIPTYSYLPAPPVSFESNVTPDKVVYQRGDTIRYALVFQLDTYHTDPGDEYIVYFGDTSLNMETSTFSESFLAGSYFLTNEDPVVGINFAVTMLSADNPPTFKATIFRVAKSTSTSIKQFKEFYIDEYTTHIITSRAYAASFNSGYGSLK